MEPVRARLGQLFDDDVLIWRVKADLSLSVDGDDIHPIHELLGQRGLKMKRFHTCVLNRGERGVYSPIDRL